MDLQERAISLAKEMHQGQFRKTGEPYFEHCFRVMKIIEQFTDNSEILAAAVLHDIFEDTDLSLSYISQHFTPQVSFIVGALSKNNKNSDIDPSYRIQMYLNRFSKGCISEPWILFIKIADQIDNSKSFSIFTEEKQLRKKNEIFDLFLPIYRKVAHKFSDENLLIYQKIIMILHSQIGEEK